MVNKYETIIIINPSSEEQVIKDLITKFSDLINNNGKIETIEEIGGFALNPRSHPSRMRGLKLFSASALKMSASRILHGCVD